MGRLSKLADLNLSFNRLSGSIPAALGNLSNVIELELQDNQLTGSIPAAVGNLTELRSLHLSTNQLSGGLPTELGNMSNMQVLSLFGNKLSGSLPAELGNLSTLSHLDVHNNPLLSGPLPQNLKNLNLEFFRFQVTSLCEPPDAGFQAWLSSIAALGSTGLLCNETPVAEAGGPYVGDVGAPITLDASGSFDPDGEITLYEWDTDNDGEYDDGNGLTKEVTFDSSGTFTVGLRVTDDGGGTDTDTADVDIVGVCGDLNDDGNVDVFDAIIILHAIVGNIEPTPAQLVLGDVDRDGSITVFDAILVLKHIVKEIEITECGLPAA